MFIGHYGASLAAKRLSPSLSLGVLFLAVQFLDVLFSVFVLLTSSWRWSPAWLIVDAR
jgi:hypothetical protein